MEAKGLRVQGYPRLHSPSLSPVGGGRVFKKQIPHLLPRASFLPSSHSSGRGRKEGVTAPHPRRPLAQGPSPALTPSGTELCHFPEFLSILSCHVASGPLLLLQDNLGLLFVPVNRDKQGLSSPGHRHFGFLLPSSFHPLRCLCTALCPAPQSHPPACPSHPQTRRILASRVLTPCSLHVSVRNCGMESSVLTQLWIKLRTVFDKGREPFSVP